MRGVAVHGCQGERGKYSLECGVWSVGYYCDVHLTCDVPATAADATLRPAPDPPLLPSPLPLPRSTL